MATSVGNKRGGMDGDHPWHGDMATIRGMQGILALPRMVTRLVQHTRRLEMPGRLGPTALRIYSLGGPLGPLGGLDSGAPWAPWDPWAPWAAWIPAPLGPLRPFGTLGTRAQGPGPLGPGPGTLGTRARDQGTGPRARDQGTRAQGPGPRAHRARDQGAKAQGPGQGGGLLFPTPLLIRPGGYGTGMATQRGE